MSENETQEAGQDNGTSAAHRIPRFLVSRIAVVLIALMWVVAGVTKV